MAQRHLDRLTAVDASFLHQEGRNSHMHVGGLTLLEGPPPAMEEFLEQIRKRLHLVPRYRHKLAYTALDSGRPVWVDDPGFNLEFHVRHTALPAPGSWEQLRNLTARIFSQALDRSKPLWEMWLIEGLWDDKFALISKTHHSLIDGIAGVDLATVLFDVEPEPEPLRHSGRHGNRSQNLTRPSLSRRACAERCAPVRRCSAARCMRSPIPSARSSEHGRPRRASARSSGPD